MPIQKPGQERLAPLIERPGVSPDFIKLEGCLLVWRESLEKSLSGRYPTALQTDASPAQTLPADACLASRVDPLPAPELLLEAAGGLNRALSDFPGLAQVVGWWPGLTKEEARVRALATCFSAAWRGDHDAWAGLAAESGLDADVLEWYGRQLCRPFFHRLGQTLASATNGPTPLRPTCPSCGGPPEMARLEREERRRYLWCGLCDLQWQFRRLACPFCGNTAHDKLGYLSIEGTGRYRIDVCEVCQAYLRTVDEADGPEGRPVDFLVEDVGTMHLCMVAEGHGYRPGGGEDASAREMREADETSSQDSARRRDP